MLKIYKGDDTNFQNLRTIRIVLQSVTFSLDGCYGEFELCGQRTKIAPLDTDVDLPIVFSHLQTAKMQIGEHDGRFRIIDSKMRIRTVSAKIKVLVTDDADEVYDTENSTILKVMPSYGSLSDLPKINGVEVSGDKEGGAYGLVTKVNGYSPKEDGSVRIPKSFVQNDPPDLNVRYVNPPNGFVENDEIFCKSDRRRYVLCREEGLYLWIEQSSRNEEITWDDIKGLPLVGETLNLRTDDEVYAAIKRIIQIFGGTVNE